jgi:hypothetical protein
VLAIHRPAGQPASWPVAWSTEAEFDLQQRLNKLPFYAPAGFGDSISDLLSKGGEIISKAGPYLDTVLAVLQDPALPQVIARAKTIRALSAGSAPATTPTAPSAAPTSFNLQRTLPLLDAVIWYQKHRWVPYVAGAGAVLLLGGIGFGIGRWTKKCRAGLGYRRRKKV